MIEVAFAGGHRQIVIQRFGCIDLRADIQTLDGPQLGKQQMPAQIIFALTVAILRAEQLAVPQQFAARQMVDFLSGIGLQLFLSGELRSIEFSI